MSGRHFECMCQRMRQGETITSYAGNFIYKEDNTGEHLEFFNHPVGYVQPEMVANVMTFDYIYQYKDHLGNIRLSYNDANHDGLITGPSTEVYSDDFENSN